MKMTKILAITATAFVLSACSPTQKQNEGAAAMAAGVKHIHNVEGYGDFTHTHGGNTAVSHSHSWNDIQAQIKGQ